MVYCRGVESMSVLPTLPVDLRTVQRYSQPVRNTPPLHSSGPTDSPSPALPIIRSESVPAESSSSPHSARQSSPAPLGHSSQGPRDKLPFHHPFRGSDKITNRKSTPEFDRKATTNTGSNDGSMKSKKVGREERREGTFHSKG
jgi:hypothetical protein